jgi:hypothetical protein
LVALVSTFVLVFTAGFNPPLWAAAIPWAVGPGLGLAAFVAVAWAAMKADRPARPPVGSTRRGGGVP